MPDTYVQIGSRLSYYSAKTRSYLHHKRIPFIERSSNLWEFQVTIPRRTGAQAVPVVITPDGKMLQDTSSIIDVLERRFPDKPVVPESPVLAAASMLFELWGDEFWLPLALHTRWSHPDENLDLFVRDVGDLLLRGAPKFLRDLAGRQFAAKITSHLGGAGINDESVPLLDRFLDIHLDALNEHFRDHAFLFGGRPSLGDFSLAGPLYAHIGRDPWSKTNLIDPRPHLKAWIERMNDPTSSEGGEFMTGNSLPVTLEPAIRSICDEMVPFISACADGMRRMPILPKDTRKAPRWLRTVRYPFAGGIHERKAPSYVIWMGQRLLERFAAMDPDDQQQVRDWLSKVGGGELLELDLPRVVRTGLSAARVAE